MAKRTKKEPTTLICNRCQGPMTHELDQEDKQHYNLKDCVEHILIRLSAAEKRVLDLTKTEG